jgi:hypothetical protein
MNKSMTILRRLSRHVPTRHRRVRVSRPAADSMPTLVLSGLAVLVCSTAMLLSHAVSSSQAFV